jgi:hypothetical protein
MQESSEFIQFNSCICSLPLYPHTKGRKFTKFEAIFDLTMLGYRGNIQTPEYPLKRGQILTSHQQLASRWKWPLNKTVALLDHLQDSGYIHCENITIHHIRVIAISMLNTKFIDEKGVIKKLILENGKVIEQTSNNYPNYNFKNKNS